MHHSFRGESPPRSFRLGHWVLALLVVALAAMPAGALELLRSTLDGGGGHSSSGTLTLTGTVAQWDAAAASGEPFILGGGFWASGPLPTAVPADGAPRFSRLFAPVPNPFNPKTSLTFDLAAPGHATLRVYGVDGRMLRVLLDEPLLAGSHTVNWDGRDEAGSELASGVYFIQMRAGAFAGVRKAVLVR